MSRGVNQPHLNPLSVTCIPRHMMLKPLPYLSPTSPYDVKASPYLSPTTPYDFEASLLSRHMILKPLPYLSSTLPYPVQWQSWRQLALCYYCRGYTKIFLCVNG